MIDRILGVFCLVLKGPLTTRRIVKIMTLSNDGSTKNSQWQQVILYMPCLHETHLQWGKLTFLWYCVNTFSIVKWHLPHVNVSRVNTAVIWKTQLRYSTQKIKHETFESSPCLLLHKIIKTSWCCASSQKPYPCCEALHCLCHCSERETQMRTM